MRREDVHLITAILVSAVLHLFAAGAWKYREAVLRFHPVSQLISFLTAPRATAPKLAEAPIPTITFVEIPEAPPKPPAPPPRSFIETDETQVTGEKPKDAPFYSDHSTVAANPKNPTGKEGDTPFLDGQGTKVVSTETVVPGPPSAPAPPKPPVVPAPKPPAPSPAPVVVAKPKEPEKPVAETGLKIVEEKKVAQATPVLPEPRVGPKPAPKPVADEIRSHEVGGTGGGREIAAVKSRMTAMGVSRSGVAAFNVAESPFGAYDKEIIRAVQSRWYGLIQQNALYERAGTVRLRFDLMADGSVQNLSVVNNSAGEILGLFCEKAIVDSAPFKPLSAELRALIGNDAREVNFTFYY